MLGSQLDPGPVRFGAQHFFQSRALLMNDESAQRCLCTRHAGDAVDAPREGALSTDDASLSCHKLIRVRGQRRFAMCVRYSVKLL